MILRTRNISGLFGERGTALSKGILMGKLRTKLIGALTVSLACSVGLLIVIQLAAETLLNHELIQKSFIQKQQEDVVSRFGSFVTQNKLTTQDRDKIQKWVHQQKYINLYLFQDGRLLFATDGFKARTESNQYLFDAFINNGTYYQVSFADAKAEIYMEYYFDYKYYYIVAVIEGILCFICFILIMVYFINQKTSYIKKLEHEIKILEGGDLSYPITVKGDDELSSLAESLNEMRLSFMDQLIDEEQAQKANKELVTAMSHDLRTPLTALVGYLDIIHFGKFKTHEDLMKYIHNSRDKAYQIKELSDKLFEYFTVFKTDEDDLELESFQGNQLVEQLIEEQLLILQNNGFQFQLDTCEARFDLKVHLTSIRRVFDNIFSNIIKYGAKSRPVFIRTDINDHQLVMVVENFINKERKDISSTGIGLRTCGRILESQHGHISVSRTKEVFSVSIRLRVY